MRESILSSSSCTSLQSSETSDADFFEGAEKSLELWFDCKNISNLTTLIDTDMDSTSNDISTHCSETLRKDLRVVPRKAWESMLDAAGCSIVSECSNAHIQSYILSESSLFVSKDRLLLKTCGTTTPLASISRIREIVKRYTAFNSVKDVFYSRKNLMRSQLQHHPHQTFEQEATFLDSIFDDGAAFCLGSVKSECWYLYTLNPLSRLTSSQSDQTLEVLMTGLDPEIMNVFTTQTSKNGMEATKLSGIDRLLPDMEIDSFLFQPCGYSMNGILKDAQYMTIHVTPQAEFSFVSFECNVPHTSYMQLIQRIADTFKPSQLSVTIFTDEKSPAQGSHREVSNLRHLSTDWQRSELQFCAYQDHELTFAHFIRSPS